jgi:OOP family OmpA-OmpF porin
MNVKSILVLLLTVGWFAVCNWWYCCKLRHACAGCAPSVESVDPSLAERPASPLVFEPSGSEALTNDAFAKFKGGIVADQSEDNLLEITGYYYPDEENNSSFDNLGLARADAIRKLFQPDIAEERIRLKASKRAGSVKDKGAYFTAADFKWIKQATKTSEVIQLADRAIILFPSASTQKVADPAIDTYLEKLAERVKQTGESISITGHTDNQGELAANQKLGLARAQVIRDFLLSKGVDRKLISISSKGETEPVASNDTEAGRYQNRRTVVRINKTTE